MRRTISTLSLMLLITLGVWAVPAYNSTVSHTQQDGTVLTLVLTGDEYQHYFVNAATGEKMYLAEDGDYHVISDEDFAAQTTTAAARRSAANQRRIMRSPSAARKVGAVSNVSGSRKGIVILVNFADVAFVTNQPQNAINNMFNQQGYNEDGHVGSVADYFSDQSYGQFNLTFDVVGPVTLSQDMAYYGANNAKGGDKRPREMAKEACTLADSQVNFADYDWDGDGTVDQVFIIYAGYGENYGADPNTIWPHEWQLKSDTTLDNVTIHTYACSSELCGTSGTTLNGIGTACHEFSHCLGYPDSYDTDYSGGIGMSYYDVMSSGNYNGPQGRGEVPVGFTAYQRWTAGWLTPVELNGAVSVTDMANLGTSATAYIIRNSDNTNEYLLLENRQSSKWFAYFRQRSGGHGLFITHIDYDPTVWDNNKPNDDPNHQRITWVPADRSYGTYNSDSKWWSVSEADQKGDFFSGSGSVTYFDPAQWSATGGKWFTQENGSDYSSLSLSGITENANGLISFQVVQGPLYTVSFSAELNISTPSPVTQTSGGSSVTLPACADISSEWTFAGWAEATVASTAVAPTLYAAGALYTPTATCTLHAVFRHIDESTVWKKVQVSGTLASGTYALITFDGYAFNGTINSSGHGEATTNAFAFDSNGKATSAPDGACIFTLTAAKQGSTTGYTLYNADHGYLYATTATSGNLAWHNTEDSYWFINSSSLVYHANTAYLQKYGDNTFRTGNSASSSKPYLAQRITTSDATYCSCPTASQQLTLVAQDDEGYWATFSADQPTFFSDDVVVYGVSVSDNTLSLSALTGTNTAVGGTNSRGYFVPANTGVLIYAVDASVTYYTAPGTAVAPITGNMLVAGSIAMSDTYDGKYYRLAYNDYANRTGLGFYYGPGCDNGQAFTARVGSAYLAVPNTAGVAVRFLLADIPDDDTVSPEPDDEIFPYPGGVPTAIEEAVECDKTAIRLINGMLVIARDHHFFTLQGQLIQ